LGVTTERKKGRGLDKYGKNRIKKWEKGGPQSQSLLTVCGESAIPFQARKAFGGNGEPTKAQVFQIKTQEGKNRKGKKS